MMDVPERYNFCSGERFVIDERLPQNLIIVAAADPFVTKSLIRHPKGAGPTLKEMLEPKPIEDIELTDYPYVAVVSPTYDLRWDYEPGRHARAGPRVPTLSERTLQLLKFCITFISDNSTEQDDARGAAESACFEWRDHSGGPVIVNVRNREKPMPRRIAITLYGIGTIMCLAFATIFFSANSHIQWQWKIENIVYTAVPMLLLFVAVFRAQIRSVTLSLYLIPMVLFAIATFILAALFHVLEEIRTWVSLAHLVIVGSAVFLDIVEFKRILHAF